MVNVSISRRYARALLDVATESGRADAVAEQLTAVAGSLSQNRELEDVLFNPAYSREQRSRVLEALMGALGQVEPVLANTLRLLGERNRLGYLPDIARLFRDMADAQAGRLRGHVTSAVPSRPRPSSSCPSSSRRSPSATWCSSPAWTPRSSAACPPRSAPPSMTAPSAPSWSRCAVS